MKSLRELQEEVKKKPCKACQEMKCGCSKEVKEDVEYQMARTELETAKRACENLLKMLKGEGDLPAWVQTKIAKGSGMLDAAADYMMSGKETGDE